MIPASTYAIAGLFNHQRLLLPLFCVLWHQLPRRSFVVTIPSIDVIPFSSTSVYATHTAEVFDCSLTKLVRLVVCGQLVVAVVSSVIHLVCTHIWASYKPSVSFFIFTCFYTVSSYYISKYDTCGIRKWKCYNPCRGRTYLHPNTGLGTCYKYCTLCYKSLTWVVLLCCSCFIDVPCLAHLMKPVCFLCYHKYNFCRDRVNRTPVNYSPPACKAGALNHWAISPFD